MFTINRYSFPPLFRAFKRINLLYTLRWKKDEERKSKETSVIISKYRLYDMLQLADIEIQIFTINQLLFGVKDYLKLLDMI